MRSKGSPKNPDFVIDGTQFFLKKGAKKLTFDDSTAYKAALKVGFSSFETLTNSSNEPSRRLFGVDFLLLTKEKDLYLVEVKDYSRDAADIPTRDSMEVLHSKIIAKMVCTMALIYGYQFSQPSHRDKEFYRFVGEAKKSENLHLVLVVHGLKLPELSEKKAQLRVVGFGKLAAALKRELPAFGVSSFSLSAPEQKDFEGKLPWTSRPRRFGL